MIGIALDHDVVEAGEFLTGTVHWSGTGMRRLIVIAEWSTDGRGNRASGIGRIAQYRAAAPDGSVPFRVRIPFEGPVSFEGELIQVTWRIRVHADRAGIDQSQSALFRVVVRLRS